MPKLMRQNQLFLFPEAYFGSMEHFEEEFIEDTDDFTLIHPCIFFEKSEQPLHNIGFFMRWMDHFSLEFSDESN